MNYHVYSNNRDKNFRILFLLKNSTRQPQSSIILCSWRQPLWSTSDSNWPRRQHTYIFVPQRIVWNKYHHVRVSNAHYALDVNGLTVLNLINQYLSITIIQTLMQCPRVVNPPPLHPPIEVTPPPLNWKWSKAKHLWFAFFSVSLYSECPVVVSFEQLWQLHINLW